MKYEELEKLYLKSLDGSLSAAESHALEDALQGNPRWATELKLYDQMRTALGAKATQTFGPYFAVKLINRIQNTGALIDREIFWFFRKFQLAAIGVVIALLVLNIVFTQGDVLSAFGLNSRTSTENEIMSFDYYEILNESL